MKKRLLYISLIILIPILAIDVYYVSKTLQEKKIETVIAQKSSPIPPNVPFIPQRLVIPALSIDTNIQQVGKDATGHMDVPNNWTDAGWYDLGYHPGEKGNAVIAGHYDNNLGLPAVFYYLKKLKPGDEIILLDAQNKKETFVVTGSQGVSVINPPLDKIFGPSSVASLNLITCEGVWNKKTRSYNERLVVFSTLKPSPSS